MANKLYPPQIEGSLPAFYLNYDPSHNIVLSANITIPFSMNAAVGVNQVKAFCLRLRTASSGSYLFAPVYSENFNLGGNTVTFGLTQSQASKLNEGQFYKAQIAYCSSAYEDATGQTVGTDVGYFSTVGIIKCTSKPEIYINNLVATNVNFFSNDYIGVYDQSGCKDQTEKVYSYEFIVYDENEEVYYTTGEKLHQSSYDTDYSFSIDKIFINDFVASGVTYSIQYKVTTMNNLILSTPKYKITNENLASPNKNIEILPEADEDNGYITIKFKGDLDLNKSWYYVLNEELLEKEKDQNGQYLEDAIRNTVKTVVYQLNNYNEKITFLKNHTLFKYYNNDNEFFYRWNSNYPSNTIKYEQNDNIRYIDENVYNSARAGISQEEFGDIALNLYPYYTPIATGRSLIKNLSYKYVQDNFFEVNLEKNYIKLNNDEQAYLIAASPYEAFYYGSYILSRASDEDNYSTWFIINRFKLDEQTPSSYSIKDITVEHGKKYKYSLQQTNIWGLISSRILSNIVYANFEDMYLYSGDKVLKIRYNPKVDSFKTNLLEQKTDTIGGRFPYITRNGETWYKQFPVGGLIAQELDKDECFITRDYGLAHRHSTLANQEGDIPENALRDYHMFSTENIKLEREFKNAVLDWLNDGVPKLFKSPYEGNYIVRLMQNTLTPVNELGRMLHNFSSQAYEIAECSYENLVRYGFINALPPSDYTSLWKTYLLTDPELKDGNGDIVIKFDVGLKTFTVQDMMPGDIIYLLFSDSADWEPIMIGITGSYTYAVGDRTITKIKIHPQSEIPQTAERNTVGVLHCYYQGVRISAFDSIIDQKLITIPSQQFIGVDPSLETLKRDTDWTKKNNNGSFSFNLGEKGYLELQNYNLRDYLDELELRTSTDSAGHKEVHYKQNDNFINRIYTFEPGDILERINATLNHGETNKIKLLNIEQAHFRLRDIIPIFVVNDDFKFNFNNKNNNKYATSPYGYPHRIEELTEFEMIDPYCIFEVYDIKDDGGWSPIENGGYIYYDAYYNNWLNNYDPTFKINYHWEKIVINPSGDEESLSDINEKYNLALNNKNQGLPYNPEDIYDTIAYKDENNKYYYLSNNGMEKNYLEEVTHFDLYWKQGDEYFAYGRKFKDFPDQAQIYYVKKYDSNISLTTIKEKHFTNLKDINSILIGNGVIAELTFQIKVIDYYTEVQDDDVRQAKQEYLEKRNFQQELPKQYAIITDANQHRIKYSALYSAYGKLLNGTNKSYLAQTDKKILKSILNNSYEVSQLNYLTLYNLTIINDKLDSTLLQKLYEYKEKNIEKTNFNFDNIKVYYFKENNVTFYYVLNSEDILPTTIINTDENAVSDDDTLTILYQQNTLNGEEIFYAVNKQAVIDLYVNQHQDKYISENELKISYNKEYSNNENEENYIDNYIFETANMAIDVNLNIIELLPYVDEQILDIKQILLNDADKELFENNKNYVSLTPIIYKDEETTPSTFFELKELQNLSEDQNIEIESVEKKLSDLNEEINNLNEEINNANDIVISEKSEYIQLYENFHNELDKYNTKVYTNWAYNEAIRLMQLGETPSGITNYFMNQGEVIEQELDEIQNKIINIIYACNNLYNQILENTPKIDRFNQMIIDATTSNDLKEYLEKQIMEKYGNSVLCLLALYDGIIELNDLLNTSEKQDEFQSDLKNIILNYKQIYSSIVNENNTLKDNYNNGFKTYLETLNNNFIQLYAYESNLIRENEEETGYTNLNSYATLGNYYDDADLIYKILNQNIDDPISIKDKDNKEISKINKVIFNNKDSYDFRIILNYINPLYDDILNLQLKYYTDKQFDEFNELKEKSVYFYRKELISSFNPSLDINPLYYTTFIFYPLVDRLDSNINDSNINTLNETGYQFNSNKEFYDQLNNQQKEDILKISSQLMSIITNILSLYNEGVYRGIDGFINYIQTNYLNENKPYNIDKLNQERENFFKENQIYKDFRNKVNYIESQLDEFKETLKFKFLTFYKLSRPWFVIDTNLPQSLMYQYEDLSKIGRLKTNDDTGDTEIQPGYFMDYLNALVQNELNNKKIILEQAQRLLELYKQQFNNYTEKYNNYKAMFDDYNTIYSSYIGTKEMDYVNSENQDITQYRQEVKKAWWNFLNLLDYKYTKEKERGMYI